MKFKIGDYVKIKEIRVENYIIKPIICKIIKYDSAFGFLLEGLNDKLLRYSNNVYKDKETRIIEIKQKIKRLLDL